MDYKNDFVLPSVIDKIRDKTTKLKSMSAEEESKMLSLTSHQRDIIVKADKVVKDEFITQPPPIHSPSLKGHQKYKAFTDLLQALK